MNNKETVGLNYEDEYYRLKNEYHCNLEEATRHLREELDKERNTKGIIIENQEKEIQFLKDIIKGILHIK